jgi:hypothetical protein
VLLFQYNGTGVGTTNSFTTTAPFTFAYSLSCPVAVSKPVAFGLLKDGDNIDLVDSNIGAKTEKGTHPDFGAKGSYEISVNAPSTCSWTVSGTT